MTFFLLIFLAVIIIKIISKDLLPLYEKNKKEFYIITGIAIFAVILFVLQICEVKILSPIQELSKLMEKAGITYKK